MTRMSFIQILMYGMQIFIIFMHIIWQKIVACFLKKCKPVNKLKQDMRNVAPEKQWTRYRGSLTGRMPETNVKTLQLTGIWYSLLQL